jgi:putative SOS response-associated peptidase YedK
MCGRFTLRTPATVLIQHFDLDVSGDRQLPLFESRYNIAPTQDVLVVRTNPADGKRSAKMMRWGLIPSWIETDKIGSGPPMINARSETLAEKPAFRTAFKRRRCIIPADGFYEWQASASGSKAKKQPYYIHRPEGEPLAFAGLWERWSSPQNANMPSAGQSSDTAAQGNLTIESCTILTTNANKMMHKLYERMPVILAPCDYQAWLDTKVEDTSALQHLLTPCGEYELIAEPVDTYVNKVANDDAKCIAIQRSLF